MYQFVIDSIRGADICLKRYPGVLEHHEWLGNSIYRSLEHANGCMNKNYFSAMRDEVINQLKNAGHRQAAELVISKMETAKI